MKNTKMKSKKNEEKKELEWENESTKKCLEKCDTRSNKNTRNMYTSPNLDPNIFDMKNVYSMWETYAFPACWEIFNQYHVLFRLGNFYHKLTVYWNVSERKKT